MAVVAVGVAGWAYGAREERVPGRNGPAILRALVVFLVLGGLALPALRGGPLEAPERVVLLDVSRSMALPARAGDAGRATRLDSALVELRRLRPDRVVLFGGTPEPADPDSLVGLAAEEDRSRLSPALEAARLGGADSAWVLTDGDLSDREAARATAARLGLGVREIRTAEPVARVGIAALRAPERARAGDTVRVTIELGAGGDRADGAVLPDSVSVELRFEGETVATARAPRPAAGRTGRVEASFVPAAAEGEAAWRRLEAVLTDPTDPLEASGRASALIEVSEAGGGAVLVSTAPGWEARFLVPTLERLALGGARGYLVLGDGRYLELGPTPRTVEAVTVRRAAAGSRLLAAHGDPTGLPAWLTAALRGHPRTVVFAGGPGEVPGTGIRASGPLPGEWYASAPIPSSPATALLSAGDLEALSPVRELLALDPVPRWTVIEVRRDRRGEARPLLVAGEADGRRWAVSGASEWWRWALRGDAGRRVYEGAMTGVVGWLLEDATVRLAALVARPAAGRPLEWRVRPGARDLAVRIVDEGGAEVFARTWPEPEPTTVGPVLPLGRYEVRVTARGPDGVFESERPIEIAPDGRELLPGEASPPLEIAPVLQSRSGIDARTPRPVWPFALAVILLCAEWIWRHRIGLR